MKLYQGLKIGKCLAFRTLLPKTFNEAFDRNGFLYESIHTFLFYFYFLFCNKKNAPHKN